MMFCIQAGNPRISGSYDETDDSLSSAIETSFPMMSEGVIMVWNNIYIPLSYKYDISYMIDDIIYILKQLRESLTGEIKVCWLPDTFRSDWTIEWYGEELNVRTVWECTISDLAGRLNNNPNISMKKSDFVCEWYQVLHTVANALKKCGYNERKIPGIKQLIYESTLIYGIGVLYKD